MPTVRTSSSKSSTRKRTGSSTRKSSASSPKGQEKTVLRQSSLAHPEHHHLLEDDGKFLNNNKRKDPIYGYYPPEVDADGYYRYRRGRVQKSPKSLNTFILLPLVFAGFGCGHFMNLLIMIVNYIFDSHNGLIHLDFTNNLHVATTLAFSATFTVCAYYAGCRHVERAFYDKEESRKRSEEWKCKPYDWLPENLRFQEVVSGCFNAAIGSIAGVSIFIYQQLPTTAPGTVKIYYNLQDPLYANWGTQYLGGWPTYFATTVVYFLAADFWAYLSHRILHWPLMYRYIHKFHHQFKAVSPFGAYALHPLEFIFIMSGFQGFVFFMPLHFSSLAVNLVYIGYHAIIDHAGVDFDGHFSFSPSTMFHDDHHTHFHCNFGQSLVFWDWLGGSLRNNKKRYGVDNFHDK